MTLWIAAAALTAIAVWFLSQPLLRRRGETRARADYALAIYRDQLAEIQRDVERSAITPAQAAAARLELERRALDAASDDGAAVSGAPARRGPAAAIALAAALPGAALALYLAVGSPDTPGQPFAERTDRGQAAAHGGPAAAAGGPDIAAMVARLAERLQREPNDRDGWVMLGRSYMVMGRHGEAADSYRRAAALGVDDAALHSAYGEALVMAGDGTVGPEARRAFETALKGDPGDPGARFYLALALEQSGEFKAALEQLTGLAADAPPDAAWLPAVRERIAALTARIAR